MADYKLALPPVEVKDTFDPEAYAKSKLSLSAESPGERVAGSSETPKDTFDPEAYATAKLATKETDTSRPITDVINRGLIASTLGSPVDIASSIISEIQKLGTVTKSHLEAIAKQHGIKIPEEPIEQPKVPETPVGGSEWFGKKMEETGMVTETRRPTEEFEAGLLPLAVGGVGVLAKGAKAGYEYAKLAKGTEAEKAAETLRTSLKGEVAKPIAAEEVAQVAPTKRIAEIEKAQADIASRDPVAAKRQQVRQQTHDVALDTLSTDKATLAEDVGGAIQPKGRENIKILKNERAEAAIGKVKDPAFEEARTREAKGDFISTNPKSAPKFQSTLDEINAQIESTPEPFRSELRKRFTAIHGEKVPLTEGEQKVEKLRSSFDPKYKEKTFATKPLTLDQAEFLRRMLTNKDLARVEGFNALDATRMKKLSEKLLDSMNEYDPRVGKYIDKYKEKSEPITRALAGRGQALTDVEIEDQEKALFTADKKATTDYFLNGTQERAERLLALTGGKDAKVINTIKGHFRNQLENMTGKQAEDFVRKQEGFLRVFPELRTPLNKIVDSKKTLDVAGEEAIKKSQTSATKLGLEKTQEEAKIKASEKISEKYKMSLNQLSEGTPKQAIENSKALVNNLRKDKLIDDDAHRALLRQIDDINTKYGNSSAAKNTVNNLARKVLLYGAYGSASVPVYLGYKALTAD